MIETLLNNLATQLNIPFVNLKHHQTNPALIRQLPEIYARRFRAIVPDEIPEGLLIGMVDPLDIYAFDELSQILKRPLKLAIVRESDLLDLIDSLYRNIDESMASYAKQLSESLQISDIDLARL